MQPTASPTRLVRSSRIPNPESRRSTWTRVSNPAPIESQVVRRLGSARLLRARGQRRAVLHPAAAAERDRHPAHGPRVPADDHGRADPLPPHARLAHAVAGRHRSRRHRDAEDRREPARRARQDAPRSGPREVRRARVGMEGGIRLDDHAPDAPPRRVGGLVARALHDGRRACRPRCGACSSSGIATDCSIAASASCTGIRCCRPRSPTSK